MKIILLFFAIIAGVSASTLPETEKAFLEKIHENCQDNTLTHVDETHFSHMERHTRDPKMMAHMLCMAQGTGMMTQDGTLNMDTIKTKMSMVLSDEQLIKKMMTKCAVQKETAMITSMDMWMCFMRNNIGYMHVL